MRHEARLLAERESARNEELEAHISAMAAHERFIAAYARVAAFRAMTPDQRDAEILRCAQAEAATLARGIRAERAPDAPTVAELEAGIGGGA